MAYCTSSNSDSQCKPDTCVHSLVVFFKYIAQATKYILPRWTERTNNTCDQFNRATHDTELSNMATSMTFSNMGVSAAEAAATPDVDRNLRSSFYVADKNPTRMDRSKSKLKRLGKSISTSFKKLLGRGKEDEVEEIRKIEISGPSNFVHIDSFNSLTGQRPQTAGTAISEGLWQRPVNHHLSVHQPLPTPPPKIQARDPEVRWTLPATTAVHGMPSTPATSKSVSTIGSFEAFHPERLQSDNAPSGTQTPLSEDIARSAWEKSKDKGLSTVPDESVEAFAIRLDGLNHATDRVKPTRPVSQYVPYSQDRATADTLKVPRVNSSPPTLPPPAAVNPRLSGFDDYRKTYYPGMYSAKSSGLREVANASDDDVEENRNAALEALQGSGADASTDEAASTTSSPKEEPRSKDKKLAYTGSYAPKATDSRIYFPMNGGVGGNFTVYEGTPYASSDALVPDRSSGSTFPSTASTAPSTPAIPFTPTDRHSHFFQKIENDCTLTPAFPGQPANPTSSATPGSIAFLENCYTDPPKMSEESDTLKVPVPARKPVPKPATAQVTRKSILKKPAAPAVAESSKSKADADLYKALPASPAPHSSRRDTPAPGSHFPPRTDSRNNPVALAEGMYLHPNAKVVPDTNANGNGTVPKRHSMNDNAYPIHDPHLSKDFTAPPEYHPRGAMNEMEAKARQHTLNREASRKAAEAKVAYKAKVKAERKAKREEKGARKLCNIQ